MQSNYKITWDNKLRQFCFKLLHRIVVTNKELKRFGIADYRKCVMCSENDSIEHARNYVTCPFSGSTMQKKPVTSEFISKLTRAIIGQRGSLGALAWIS